MTSTSLLAFCGLILLPAGSRAQAGGPNVLDGLRGGFAEVHTAVSKSADLVPANKYTYRPVATVRTFGELVAHVADSYAWYCSRASGRNVQWSDAIEKGKTDKATVTQKLRESLAMCTAAYGNGSSNLGNLMANIAHTNLNPLRFLRFDSHDDRATRFRVLRRVVEQVGKHLGQPNCVAHDPQVAVRGLEHEAMPS